MKLALTKKQIIIGSVVVAVAVIIVLVAALSGGKKTDTAEESNLSVTAMTPVEKAGMRYAFDGIKWELETKNDDSNLVETKVGFFFDNFTRKENGTPTDFNRPFAIGNYQGVCVEKSGVSNPNDQLLALGIPVGFVFCEFDGQETFIGLFQKDVIVSAYRWDTADQEPVHIRDIDMSTIVKSGGTVSKKAETVIAEPVPVVTYPPRKNRIQNSVPVNM